MKTLLIVAGAFVVLLLARHWDYEDSQKVRHAEYVARVANR